MLDGGALAGQDGESEQAAHHRHGAQNAGNGQLFGVALIHGKVLLSKWMGKHTKADSVSPFSGPEGQTGSSLGSVGAYWPPLTPEHGFPSLLYAARAQGAPPLPAPGQAGAPMCLLTLPSERIKKRGARWAPRLVTASMTPYGGMTHIR